MTISRNLSFLAEGVSSTGVLGASNGGSGASTLTGYLYGNGTSAFTASTTIPTSALSGTISNSQLANSSLTVNGTSISLGGSGTVTAAAGTLTGTTLNSTVVSSSLTSVGTLTSGTWNASTIGAIYGGTGQNTVTTGDLLYGSASNTWSKLGIGSTGTILRVVGGVPTWGTDYTGTVTSVAASVPSFLSISGSPITTSGTLAITYSGTALPVANGGTGLVSLTTNYIPYGNGTGAFSSSSSFIFNGTNFAVGLTAPYNATTDIGSFAKSYAGVSQVVIDNQTSTGTSGLSFSAYGGGWNLQVPGSTSFINPLIFKFNSTETVRFFSSGGVSIGNTTDPGATNLSVNGVIKIGSNQAVNGPAFSAYGNSIQTLTNNIYTKVAFNTSVFDTNSNYSTSNYRFTPTVAGYYQINVACNMTLSLVTQLVLYIYKNGSNYQNVFSDYNGGATITKSSSTIIGGSSIVYLNGSSDYIEIYVYASTTGTTTVNGYSARPDVNYFNASMIRGA